MSSPFDSPPPPVILVADDEKMVLKAISVTLEQLSYQVLQAGDGNEARVLLDKHRGQPLNLLVTDMDMPGCNGRELADYAREHFSGLKVLYTSGKPQRTLMTAIIGDHDVRFLEKPFAAPELLNCIRSLLEN